MKNIKNLKLVACLSITGFLSLTGINVYQNNDFFVFESQAAEITNTWDSGNTTVTLDSEGTLTITAKPGTDGRMADFFYGDGSPVYSSQLSKVKKVEVNQGVTHIGAKGIVSMTGTTRLDIVLPEGIESIGDYAFGWSPAIKSITFPTTLRKQGNSIVYDSFYIEEMIYLGDIGLIENSSTLCGKITVAPNYTKIPDEFFKTTKFTDEEFIIPDTCTYIGESAFYGSKVKIGKLPDSIVYIGSNAFYRCENSSISNLPKNLEYLGNYAIESNITEKNIEVPKTLKHAGIGAMYGFICSNLDEVKDTCWFGENSFNNVNTLPYVGLAIENIDGEIHKLTYYKDTNTVKLDGIPERTLRLDGFEVPNNKYIFDLTDIKTFDRPYIYYLKNNSYYMAEVILSDEIKSVDVNPFTWGNQHLYKVTYSGADDLEKIGKHLDAKGNISVVNIGVKTKNGVFPSNLIVENKIDVHSDSKKIDIKNIDNLVLPNQSSIGVYGDFNEIEMYSKDLGYSFHSTEPIIKLKLNSNKVNFVRMGESSISINHDITSPLSFSKNIPKIVDSKFSLGYNYYNFPELKNSEIYNGYSSNILDVTNIVGNVKIDAFNTLKIASIEEGSNIELSNMDYSKLKIGTSFKGIDFNKTNVNLEIDKLNEIPDNAFNGTMLKDTNISVQCDIGAGAFYKSNISEITLNKEGGTTIGKDAFRYTTSGNVKITSDNLITALDGSLVVNSNTLVDTGNSPLHLMAYAYNGYSGDISLDNNLKGMHVDAFTSSLVKDLKYTSDYNFYAKIPTSCKNAYLLGGISANMQRSFIPTTCRVWCLEGSEVELWCKNNSVVYTSMTQEEADNIKNGILPTLQTDSLLFDANIPTDLIYNISLGIKPAGASGISQVIVDSKKIEEKYWDFNGIDKLTLKKEYLEQLANGTHSVSVQFDNGTFRSGASVAIINSNISGGGTLPPEALVTIKYEFYKDYPDYVIIPVTMNGATDIKSLKIGSDIIDKTHYELQDGAIIISKDYLSTLNAGKYRILPTFNDLANTTITNIQLIVYNEAADRAAPYLLQSRIVFNGSPIVLTYDPGKGDLESNNVLALVLDNEIILPNGKKLPFTSNNINNIQRAFINIDKEIIEKGTPSNATKSESIEIKVPQVEEDIFNKDVVLNDENELIDDNFNVDSVESDLEITDLDNDDTVTNLEEIQPSEEQEIIEDEIESETIENIEIETNIGLADSFVMLYNDSVDYDKVFTVDGTQITLDGDYITSLNLNDGDHLIGAIFDNTERTTDVKKVILTIESEEPETPVIPPVTEPENPSVKPEEPNEPSGGGSSSGGGGSSGGGNSSKPSIPTNPSLPDGSINPDYKPNIPDSGGSFEGNGDDWVYVKPDGSHANNEWVSDGKDWYYIDGNSKLKYDWAYINNEWYMLNRDHDGKFGAAKFGWYHEKQDNKWYFLNPMDTKMLTGWQKIKGEWYYFNINTGEPTYVGDNKTGWTYTNKENKPHGAMYSNEITPDGYKLDETGKWVK